MSIWARPALTLKEAISGTSEAAERPAAASLAGTRLVGVAKVMLSWMYLGCWRRETRACGWRRKRRREREKRKREGERRGKKERDGDENKVRRNFKFRW